MITKVDKRILRCPKCNQNRVLVRRGKVWTKAKPHERRVFYCKNCGKHSVVVTSRHKASYFPNSRYSFELLKFLHKIITEKRAFYDTPSKYWNKQSKESGYYSNKELRDLVVKKSKFKKKFQGVQCVN
ncbi:MAG: hypothetical protein IH845_05360 [Nanoarchaeota archaeon]|nr:hypothetical protein [Nanoarchaeota archaeon]